MTEPTQAGRTTESGPPVAPGPGSPYDGSGTARESNARYKRLIADGTTGLTVAFDLPTRMGRDSDTPHASGEVGRAGVAIDSLDDMRVLFAGIPLDTVTTSMAINAPAAPLLLLYQLVAEEQGVPATALTGTIRNDVPEEYDARGRYVFPPKPSLRLMADMFRYCRAELPRWTTVSVEGAEPYEQLPAAPGIEERQTERLAKLRAWRCGDRVHRALAAVTAAAGGDDNVLPPMKEALSAGATVGEVCDALREAWGAHAPADPRVARRVETRLGTAVGTAVGTV
ncbi:methylmalonyl-CoA mutase family protein [Streptomyces gardneri]|uniref:methylmalonyl-CoA mutase family protein n=1 Tax=Streptomyces gardneri TaxID=66892 RepID=UPI00368E7CC4